MRSCHENRDSGHNGEWCKEYQAKSANIIKSILSRYYLGGKSNLSRTIAANLQSPDILVVLSSSLILSVIILISFRIKSSSCFTGGDIVKDSNNVLGGDLREENYLMMIFVEINTFCDESHLVWVVTFD